MIDPNKTKLTPRIANHIKNNLDISAKELAEEFDINQPLVELIQKVQREPILQKKGVGKRKWTRKIESKDDVYTVKQASEYLPYSSPELVRKLNSNEVRGRKIKGIWIISEKDLRNEIEEVENEQ